MEENAVSKEEMLKTNKKNDEGKDAEDDNSNDESSSHSSSSDEEEEEDDIEVHVSSSKEIPVELVQSVTTHCAYRGLRNKRTNKSRSFDHRVEKYNEPLQISLRLNTRTCLRSDIEQHTQPLSFVGSIVLGLWLKFNLVKAIIDSHNKILYARHADQRKVTFQRVLQTGVEFDQDVRAMLLRANILKHEHIYACSRTALLNMAPLPPHEQRHPFLGCDGGPCGDRLGGAKRRMSWREFILALGLHTWEEMESPDFARY
ncbi:COP9 signalosome complex subunit 1 [Tanacetum coccineum]